MKFHNALENIAGSRAKARIIGTMAAFPSRKWTGRALALQSGFSQPRAWRVLHELSEQGIVSFERAGNSEIWAFNEMHLFAEDLKRFAGAKQALLDSLLRAVKTEVGLARLDRVILFGSVARGDELPGSDIDILVVFRLARDEQQIRAGFAKVEFKLERMTGNAPRAIFYSEREFEAKRRRDAFIMEAVRDGLIVYQRGAINDGQ